MAIGTPGGANRGHSGSEIRGRRLSRLSFLLRLGAILLAPAAWGQNPPAAPPSPQALPAQAFEESAPDPAGPAAASPESYSRFRLHAYSDVDFSHRAAPGEPNHYSVDEIDLFATAAITPQLTALAEVVIDTGVTPTLSSVPVNVERLLLQYRASRYLQVEAGQFRTALGYYSTAYLRGAWFQTAISRPRLFAFEEDGGVLPLHTVGISASGAIPSGWLGLSYVVQTGNTRTWGALGASGVAGRNAVNVALYMRPRPLPGVELGISEYRDQYSPVGGLNIDRGGFLAHAVYTAGRFEFLNEGGVARLHYGPANAAGRLYGFYSQLGYRAGPNWGPYARVEKISVHSDAFFNALAAQAVWRSMYTAGVRYDWNAHVAVKLEAGREADWGAPHYSQAAMQVAFAF